MYYRTTKHVWYKCKRWYEGVLVTFVLKEHVLRSKRLGADALNYVMYFVMTKSGMAARVYEAGWLPKYREGIETSLQKLPNQLWDPPILLFSSWGTFPGTKRPGREDHHLKPVPRWKWAQLQLHSPHTFMFVRSVTFPFAFIEIRHDLFMAA